MVRFKAKPPVVTVTPLGSKLWGYFFELHRTRTYVESNPNPLTYLEIQAWRDLTGSVVSADDIKILRKMDDVFISTYLEELRENEERRKEEEEYYDG